MSRCSSPIFAIGSRPAAQVGAVAEIQIAPQGNGLWKTAMKAVKKARPSTF